MGRDIGEVVSSAAGAIFYLPIILMYLYALLFPELNADFIFNFGMLIFLLEFLNIHSSGMILGFGRPGGYLLVIIYAAFVGVFGAIFGNWMVLGIFIASIAAKTLHTRERSREEIGKVIGVNIMVYLLSVFAVSFLSPLWAFLFPFSEEVLAQKMPGSSGLFVEVPQTLLVWGLTYFSILLALDLRAGLRLLKGKKT